MKKKVVVKDSIDALTDAVREVVANITMGHSTELDISQVSDGALKDDLKERFSIEIVDNS